MGDDLTRRITPAAEERFAGFQIEKMVAEGEFKFLKDRNPGQCKRLIIVTTEQECDEAIELLYKEMGAVRIVGVDREGITEKNFHIWAKKHRSLFRNLDATTIKCGEAGKSPLVQISSMSGSVTVFVCLAKFLVAPKSLKKFLANPQILKVGSAIGVDSYLLETQWQMPIVCFFDVPFILSYFQSHLPADSMQLSTYKTGLKAMATLFFGESVLPFYDKTLKKLDEYKLKNFSWQTFWGSQQLDEDQKVYGSFDSQVAVDMMGVTVEFIFDIRFDINGQIEGGATIMKELLNLLRFHINTNFLPYRTKEILDTRDKHGCPDLTGLDPGSKAYAEAVSHMKIFMSVYTRIGSKLNPVTSSRDTKHLILSGRRTPSNTGQRLREELEQKEYGFFPKEFGQFLIANISSGKRMQHLDVYFFKLYRKFGRCFQNLPFGQFTIGMKTADIRNAHKEIPECRFWFEIERTVCLDKIQLAGQSEIASRVHRLFESWKGAAKPYFDESHADLVKEEDKLKMELSAYIGDDQVNVSKSTVQSLVKVNMRSDDIFFDFLNDGEEEDMIGLEQKERARHNRELERERTMYGCWFCGENLARLIRLEPIVPSSYRDVYLKNSPCMCNYARLCVNCTRSWRLIQYETMVELAEKFDAPLESPSMTVRPNIYEVIVAICRLKKFLTVFLGMKSDDFNTREFCDKMAAAGFSEKTNVYAIKNWITVQRYLRKVYNEENAWGHMPGGDEIIGCQIMDNHIIELFEQCIVAKRNTHEYKVFMELKQNPVELEKVFRQKLWQNASRHHLFPPNWHTEHRCLTHIRCETETKGQKIQMCDFLNNPQTTFAAISAGHCEKVEPIEVESEPSKIVWYGQKNLKFARMRDKMLKKIQWLKKNQVRFEREKREKKRRERIEEEKILDQITKDLVERREREEREEMFNSSNIVNQPTMNNDNTSSSRFGGVYNKPNLSSLMNENKCVSPGLPQTVSVGRGILYIDDYVPCFDDQPVSVGLGGIGRGIPVARKGIMRTPPSQIVVDVNPVGACESESDSKKNVKFSSFVSEIELSFTEEEEENAPAIPPVSQADKFERFSHLASRKLFGDQKAQKPKPPFESNIAQTRENVDSYSGAGVNNSYPFEQTHRNQSLVSGGGVPPVVVRETNQDNGGNSYFSPNETVSADVSARSGLGGVGSGKMTPFSNSETVNQTSTGYCSGLGGIGRGKKA